MVRECRLLPGSKQATEVGLQHLWNNAYCQRHSTLPGEGVPFATNPVQQVRSNLVFVDIFNAVHVTVVRLCSENQQAARFEQERKARFRF
mmetsp:Transcript_19647/g.42458  ORF Transcript_19647/g.42458 Transcript_19647/m.42458 type:complete len:90 (+) Transcript_19647:72-341(+)